MSKSFNLKTLIFSVIILSATLSVIFVGVAIYRSIEEAAVGACISSIRSLLLFALRKDEVQKTMILTDEWRMIDQEEKELLFSNIDQPRYRFPYYKEGKTETGENLQIRVKKVDGNVDLRIEGFPLQ